MEIAQKNIVEQRQTKWTTCMNLNMWFNTWDGVLVKLRFARLKREGGNCEGSVVFFERQKNRIINLMRPMEPLIILVEK